MTVTEGVAFRRLVLPGGVVGVQVDRPPLPGLSTPNDDMCVENLVRVDGEAPEEPVEQAS